MPKIRVRKKNQITIPLRIAEEAGIKPDDVLDISYANGVVTVMPAGKTRGSRSIMDYAGIGSGVWGTTLDEIENEREKDKESPTAQETPNSLPE
ncbi:AbrB/MazE/SpoVT family DNA-binding domain-containing protein [Prosthecochloris sp. CIB 2401]|uniref:AbrB/MazE/SpoVT family DNA-binding domain-containing protein n=1 Tax=Prosthecochloris sp. CIB 2401 TaxID=1868325 RepID=UPI00080AB68C|nr:AbrB/MazE/SpoVT family DNA-binding domain-containing protein [Prosthecochloris sp. CIB 2401]ANT64730.1 hypothetical protein Ptc2401_00947 [Prosthecochloris sp. CIB 2401]